MRRLKKKPEIIDISTLISEDTRVYPGDPGPVISHLSGIDDSTSLSLLSISTHTGTHIDPPLHLFKGKPGIDEIDLNSVLGWAELHDLSGCKVITTKELKKLEFKEDIILLKTGNHDSFLTRDAAKYIAEMNPVSVGIDSLSVDSPDTTDAHGILLEKGMLIIEGLNFEKVSPDRYYFICLPLRIRNGDGGPARAILLRE